MEKTRLLINDDAAFSVSNRVNQKLWEKFAEKNLHPPKKGVKKKKEEKFLEMDRRSSFASLPLSLLHFTAAIARWSAPQHIHAPQKKKLPERHGGGRSESFWAGAPACMYVRMVCMCVMCNFHMCYAWYWNSEGNFEITSFVKRKKNVEK